MTAKRRCPPCCGEEDDPPPEECGCDGPLYFTATNINATWSYHICEGPDSVCNPDESWAGNSITWTVESGFADIRFECSEIGSSGTYEWAIVGPGDYPAYFRLVVSLSGDDFPFAANSDEPCDETYVPAGSMDVTFYSDDLPDGVTIEKWEGTIRNEFWFPAGASVAVMRVSIRIRFTDLFDDWTSLTPQYPAFDSLGVINQNPQIVWHINIIRVSDTTFGTDSCPKDLTWSDAVVNYMLVGIPGDPIYSPEGGQFNNPASWISPPETPPDCETICDTFPYPAGSTGCGGASGDFAEFTGSMEIPTVGYRTSSWDTVTYTLLDLPTAP